MLITIVVSALAVIIGVNTASYCKSLKRRYRDGNCPKALRVPGGTGVSPLRGGSHGRKGSSPIEIALHSPNFPCQRLLLILLVNYQLYAKMVWRYVMGAV